MLANSASQDSQCGQDSQSLAGKKVAKYSTLGRTVNGTRDLRVQRQRSYHCASPSAERKVVP